MEAVEPDRIGPARSKMKTGGPEPCGATFASPRWDLRRSAARTRSVQVGESASPTISLPAAVLRSSGLEIVGAGSGSVPPRDVMLDAYHQLMARAASGELRVDTEQVPLVEIEAAWQRPDPTRRRLVIVP